RRHPAPVAQRGVPAGVVDVKVGAEHIVHLFEADAEREQLVEPALLAGKIDRRRMALVLAAAGVSQDRVARSANDEGLVGDHHFSRGRVEELRLHLRQMMIEYGSVIGREKILRTSPRPLALDHRIDRDIADPDLLHVGFALTFFPAAYPANHDSSRFVARMKRSEIRGRLPEWFVIDAISSRVGRSSSL